MGLFEAEIGEVSIGYLDLLGTRKALEDKSGLAMIQKAHTMIWTFATHGPMSGGLPDFNITGLSDSFFVVPKEDVGVEGLYAIMDGLRRVLKGNEIDSYAIVNREEGVIPSSHPPTGATRNNYRCIVTAGAAWANVYLADKAIPSIPTWRDNYRFYVIGDENLLKDRPSKASHRYAGLGGVSKVIHAIE